MRKNSHQIDTGTGVLATKRIDCAVIYACNEAAPGEIEGSNELMLIVNQRPGRHPVRIVPRFDQICWVAHDGLVESLAIEPTSPSFLEVFSEIKDRGLLVAELIDGSDLNLSMKDIQSGAQAADFWLLDNAPLKEYAVEAGV